MSWLLLNAPSVIYCLLVGRDFVSQLRLAYCCISVFGKRDNMEDA